MGINAHAEVIWVGNGDSVNWFDTNKDDKNNNDELTGDGRYCWAATAANIISWWQSQPQNAYAVQDSSAPQGQQSIWDTFRDTFINDSGHEASAFNWYFNGDNLGYPSPKPNATNTAGNFYQGVEFDFYDCQVIDPRRFEGSGWIFEDNDYAFRKEAKDADKDMYLTFSSKLKGYLENGYAIGIAVGAGYQHAITLWGAEFDNQSGYITSVWVTDSDDASASSVDELGMFELKCTPGVVEYGNEYIFMGSVDLFMVTSTEEAEDGAHWYDASRMDNIYEFTAFKAVPKNLAPTVPEPATGTLSLLALAGLCARRRRK